MGDDTLTSAERDAQALAEAGNLWTGAAKYRCPEEQHRRLGNEDHGLRAAAIELRTRFAQRFGLDPRRVVVSWGWGIVEETEPGCREWVVTLVAYERPGA